MCTERPKPRLDYWGGKCSEPQSATEHATSTSRQNCVQIQYLNPSRLKRVARAIGLTWLIIRLATVNNDVDNCDLTQLLKGSGNETTLGVWL